MTGNDAAAGRFRRVGTSLVAIIYVFLVAGLVVLWGVNQIDDQLRTQPDRGRCGGVMVPAGGAPQGQAADCELVPGRAALLIATGFALLLPMFLPGAVLAFYPRRIEDIGVLRVTLCVLVGLASILGALGVVIGMVDNAHGEFCTYQRTGFAPWWVGDLPCWPQWREVALHWALAFGAVGVIGLPTLALVALLQCWRRR